MSTKANKTAVSISAGQPRPDGQIESQRYDGWSGGRRRVFDGKKQTEGQAIGGIEEITK